MADLYFYLQISSESDGSNRRTETLERYQTLIGKYGESSESGGVNYQFIPIQVRLRLVFLLGVP